ncbi:hypothetical protein GCM10027445_12480 [Amycolatopsis endophytica]|uniref:Uncharacterized protein n=1 Tax=Amycolatopsis endophytica TaxID=860233 RepID=A0A853B3H6_9PSEU|nr:hypothetical protein [Amycolatopsis endophytica]NYI89385.1 hypothetical protein [Amycolatopsis endophytica]
MLDVTGEDDPGESDFDGHVEPPVPPALGALTAAQRVLAEFLRLDGDLIAIAAQASPALAETADDSDGLAAWVAGLLVSEKDRLLTRVVQGEAARVRMELLHRFRGHRHSPPTRGGSGT